ncbi:MAG: hypothetical protein K2Q32_07125 [Alphaproteobacteria bacterium]|nr:hypothetical protein [Alphaproteobacteria bacterium]
MTQPLSLPIIATVKAAYGDVFAKPMAFIKVMWLVLLMMILFVDLPMMVTQREAYLSMHPDKRAEQTEKIGPAKIDVPDTEKQATEKPTEATDKALSTEASSLKPEYALAMLGISLLQLVLLFSYSVAWYRQLLFGDKKDKTIMFRFGKMEYQFAVTAMKNGLVLAPIMLVMMSYYMSSIPGFSDGEPINIIDYWWLFLAGIILVLYLVARLSMSYPLTMMGQFDEPIKQSWNLTNGQSLQIALGFINMVVPASIALIVIVVGASYLMNFGAQPTDEELNRNLDLAFAEHLVYRVIGATYMLYVFALVTAFYARSYAFLVRSQQSPPTA